MEIDVGDLVRVATNPKGAPDILGYVGFVDEVKDDWVSILALHPDGSIRGGGSMPAEHLVPETRPEWVEALAKYHTKREAYARECQERQTRWVKCLAECAAKHGVTPAIALEIYNDLQKFEG